MTSARVGTVVAVACLVAAGCTEFAIDVKNHLAESTAFIESLVLD
jgi:hypothetical protein